MKKILIIIGLICLGRLVYSFENDNEFTYSDYEVLCFQYGIEPTWEQFEWLAENPQCICDVDTIDN